MAAIALRVVGQVARSPPSRPARNKIPPLPAAEVARGPDSAETTERPATLGFKTGSRVGMALDIFPHGNIMAACRVHGPPLTYSTPSPSLVGGRLLSCWGGAGRWRLERWL